MGLPAAGKSTYADSTMNMPDNGVIMSVADFAENNGSGPRLTEDSWEDIYCEVRDMFDEGSPVVIDGNNTQSASRERILRTSRNLGAERAVLHVLCTPPNVCLKQMKYDPADRQAVQKMLRHHTNLFMQSIAQAQHEGWDKIIYIDPRN